MQIAQRGERGERREGSTSAAIFDFRFKEHFGQKQTPYIALRPLLLSLPLPLTKSSDVNKEKKGTKSASFVCQRKTTTTTTTIHMHVRVRVCASVFLHILRTIRVNVLAKPEVDLDTLELLLYPAMSECVCVCVYSHLLAAFCRTFSVFFSLFCSAVLWLFSLASCWPLFRWLP